MLARKNIPSNYLSWNDKFAAPFGKNLPCWLPKKLLSPRFVQKIRGPFSIQPNNDTRIFEYPWAFYAGNIKSGVNVLEIGGGLSGFQFICSKFDANVTNVDPGLDAKGVGWQVDNKTICYLNKVFGTNVELLNTFIKNTALEDDYFDVAYAISVIEHIPKNELPDLITRIYKALKPGGLLIMTVDLFLDLYPFTDQSDNIYGENIDIMKLISYSNWEVVVGSKEELFGFPEFSVNTILRTLPEYFLGQGYPVLVQCLVLRKPDAYGCN